MLTRAILSDVERMIVHEGPVNGRLDSRTALRPEIAQLKLTTDLRCFQPVVYHNRDAAENAGTSATITGWGS